LGPIKGITRKRRKVGAYMRYDTYLKVQQLAESFGTYDPFPIAENLGFKVHFKDIGSNMGFCTSILGVTNIVISDSLRDSPNRLPVMAHELCHGVEDTSCVSWYTLGNYQKNSAEYKANMFACQELSKLYEEQYEQLPYDFNSLQAAYGLPDEFIQFFSFN